MSVRPLDDDQLRAFDRDGFVVFGPVLAPHECEQMVAEERRLRSDDSYGRSPGLVVMDQLEHVSRLVRWFCCEGHHLDVVEQLLGPDVVLTHNQFVTKLPGAGVSESAIPLHQDDGYGTLDPPDDLTVWVALTDTTTDNGCLVVAPSSHLGGIVEHRVAAHNPAFREASTVEVIPLELAAGEAVAFSGLLLHGSGDNLTDRERVALFARYCRPDVVMVTEGGKPVLEDGHSWMVRGEAPMSVWRSANAKFTDP
ncbi:MAG TPA: phytanoyl-CoA dioxygenase family protein [Ilumatobacter sp.]|nr:phytanoyl-CoA dioxygenase family protein [Ilumatobacter sp.]